MKHWFKLLLSDSVFRVVIRRRPLLTIVLFNNFLKRLKKSLYLKLELKLDKLFNFRYKRFKGHQKVLDLLSELDKDTTKITITDLSIKNNTHTFSPSSNLVDTNIRRGEIELKLSSISFLEKFDDTEDFFWLHRFSWIFDGLAHEPNEAIVLLIKNKILVWIDRNEEKLLASDAYSICERILHWLYFYLLYSKSIFTEDEKSKYLKSIQQQLTLLCQKLEYHCVYTNNHVLNNGRALYIGGAILNHNLFKQIGANIIFFNYDDIILDGVVQEDSSNYQILLTRSFTEVYLFASLTLDNKMCQWLEERLKKMFAYSRRIFGEANKTTYPFFGDISPDCSPNFLQGYPFSHRQNQPSKWFRLFKPLFSKMTALDLFQNNLQFEAQTKLNKIIYKKVFDFELYIMSKQSGIKAHGHNDQGGICLFYKNKPLIIDPGLKNYTKESISLNQKSHTTHNFPSLDQLPTDIEVFSPYFNQKHCSTFSLQEEEINHISYQVNYIFNQGTIQRSITFTPATCKIVDTNLTDRKSVLYQNTFIWNDELSFDKGKYSLKQERSKFSIDFSDNTAIQHSTIQVSTRYGLSETKASIHLNSTLSKQEDVSILISLI